MAPQDGPNRNCKNKPQGISKRPQQSRAASSRGAPGPHRSQCPRRGSTRASATFRPYEEFATQAPPPSLRATRDLATTQPKPKPKQSEHWKEAIPQAKEFVKRFIEKGLLPGKPVKQPARGSQGPQSQEDDPRSRHRGDLHDSNSHDAEEPERELPLQPTSPKDAENSRSQVGLDKNAGGATTSAKSDVKRLAEGEAAYSSDTPGSIFVEDSASGENADDRSSDDGYFSCNEGDGEPTGDEMDLDD